MILFGISSELYSKPNPQDNTENDSKPFTSLPYNSQLEVQF
jgi:hypothetical protein